METQKWIDEGGIYYPVSANVVLHKTPGPGIWKVTQGPNPMDPRLGLAKVGDKFDFKFKIYETGGRAIIDRVKKLWNLEEFEETEKNLGIILNGIKGTGKTISAKILCNEIDLPVILVDNSFDGAILGFIQALDFECVIFFDEAEKTFTDKDNEILLKVIDGTLNRSRKLYVLTTNRLTVNENLLGRPGRIRYIQEFGNLPTSTINEYLEDNLIDKSKKEELLEQIDLLEISTIDILKTMVEEVNIMGGMDDNCPLNIPKASHAFDIVRFNGAEEANIEEIFTFIQEHNPHGISLHKWFNSVWSEVLDPEKGKKKKKSPLELKEKGCDESVEMDPETAKKTKKLKKEGFNPDQRMTDILEENMPFLNGCWTTRMTSSSDILFEGSYTSIGNIVKAPDPNGFFVVKNRWDDENEIYLIIRKKDNPSLYGGKLGRFIL